jgi:hypothetical protein
VDIDGGGTVDTQVTSSRVDDEQGLLLLVFGLVLLGAVALLFMLGA